MCDTPWPPDPGDSAYLPGCCWESQSLAGMSEPALPTSEEKSDSLGLVFRGPAFWRTVRKWRRASGRRNRLFPRGKQRLLDTPSSISTGPAGTRPCRGEITSPRASAYFRSQGSDMARAKQQKNRYPRLQMNVGFLSGLSGRQKRRILGDFSFLRNQEKAKTDLHGCTCGSGGKCLFSSH